jgi:hypothetical protein
MADQYIDIERMIMQAQYMMHLEASPVQGRIADMEREQYQNQIKELVASVRTLLDANYAMGEKLQKLEGIAVAYEDLKVRYAKLEGELAMRKRGRYGKGSEKPSGKASSDKDRTKDEDEEDYIENGSRREERLPMKAMRRRKRLRRRRLPQRRNAT